MIKDDLVSYIKKELAMGTPKETLMTSLKAGGWTEQDIQDSMGEFDRIKKEEIHPTIAKMLTHHHPVKAAAKIIVFTVIVFLVIAYILGGK